MKTLIAALLLAGALGSAGPEMSAPPLESRLDQLEAAGASELYLESARALSDGRDERADRAAAAYLREQAGSGDPLAAVLMARLVEEMHLLERRPGAYAGWVAAAREAPGPAGEIADGLSRRLQVYRAYEGRAAGSVAAARERLGLTSGAGEITPEIRAAVTTPSRLRPRTGDLREIPAGSPQSTVDDDPQGSNAGAPDRDTGDGDTADGDAANGEVADGNDWGVGGPEADGADAGAPTARAARTGGSVDMVIGWDKERAHLRRAVEATRGIVPRAMAGVAGRMKPMAHPEQGQGYTLILTGIATERDARTICAVLRVRDCAAAIAEADRLAAAAQTERATSVAEGSAAEGSAANSSTTDETGRRADPVDATARARGAPFPEDANVVRAPSEAAEFPPPVSKPPVPAGFSADPEVEGERESLGDAGSTGEAASTEDAGRAGDARGVGRTPGADASSDASADASADSGAGDGAGAAGDTGDTGDLSEAVDGGATKPESADRSGPVLPDDGVLARAEASEGEPLVFQVPLPAHPESYVLEYEVVGGTATAPGIVSVRREGAGVRVRLRDRVDLGADAGRTEVSARSGTVTVILPTRPDDLVEDDETVVLEVARNGEILGRLHGKIRDDDGVATLSAVQAVDIGEGRAGRIHLGLDKPRDRATEVIWRLQDLDGAPEAIPGHGRVTIPAGGREAVIETSFADDNLHAPEARYRLAVLADGVTDTATGSVYRGVDDEPAPALTVPAARTREGRDLVFRPRLDGRVYGPVTLSWTARVLGRESDDALGRGGLPEPEGSVTIPHGKTEARIVVPTRQDEVHEGDVRVALDLVEPSGKVRIGVSGSGRGVVEDDDPRPAARLVAGPDAAIRDLAAGPLEIELDAPAARPLSYRWRAGDVTGSAVEGDVTLPPGQVSAPIAPAFSEVPAEGGVDVRVFRVVDGVVAEESEAWVRLRRPSELARVSIEGAEIAEGETARLRVHLAGPSTRWRQVGWRAEGEVSVIVGSKAGELLVPPGVETARIGLMTRDDALHDSDGARRIRVRLLGGENVMVDGEPADLRVADNDAPARLVAPPDLRLTEGESDELLLELTRAVDRPVTVAVRQITRGLHLGADLTALPEVVTIPAGTRQLRLPFTAIADKLHEGDKRVVLELRAADLADSVHRFAVTLVDGDPRPTARIAAPERLTEGDRVTAVLDLDRGLASGGWVDVGLAGAPGEGVDLTVPERILLLPGARRVEIPVAYADDDLHTPSTRVTLTVEGRGLAEAASHTFKLIDREPAPRVEVANGSGSERSGEVVVPVTLDRASSAPVTVSYRATAGTADIGPEGDLPAVSGVLEIPPGSQEGEIRIPVRRDGVPEGREQFALVLSDWSGVTEAREMVIVCEILDGGMSPGARLLERIELSELSGEKRAEIEAAERAERRVLRRRLTEAGVVLPARSREAGARPAQSASDPLGDVLEGDFLEGDVFDGGVLDGRAPVDTGAPPRPYLLLGSFRALESARTEVERVRRLIGDRLAARTLEVRRLGGDGARVFGVTASDFPEAAGARAVCERARSAGLACLARE